MLKANKIFFAKLAELFVLWIVQIWCLQAYSLVDNTKQRNRTTIYVSYIDMNKWKRNWALSVVVYKIYHSYHVDQSSRLSGVTSFVERSLPPWEIEQKPQETRDEHVARLFEGNAGNNCVCLRWFAVSDSASRFSVRSGDRKMSFFHEVEGTQYPLHTNLSLITVSKFSERHIRPFRAFPGEAATRYVWSDE